MTSALQLPALPDANRARGGRASGGLTDLTDALADPLHPDINDTDRANRWEWLLRSCALLGGVADVCFQAQLTDGQQDGGSGGAAELSMVRYRRNETIPLPPAFDASGLLRFCARHLDGAKAFTTWKGLTHTIEDRLLLSDPTDPGRQPLRFRVSLFRHDEGVELTARVLAPVIPKSSALGIPHNIIELFNNRDHGLILVSGATGHGKSTTIASLVQERALRQTLRIITLEDPIEFRFLNAAEMKVATGEAIRATSNSRFRQRQVGRDTPTYAAGLKEALRQSPNIIIVQEIRDPAAAEAAISAALSGHLVISTIHAGHPWEALQRMASFLDRASAGGQGDVNGLAACEPLVISQQLLPGRDGKLAAVHEVCVNTPVVRNCIIGRDWLGIKMDMENGRSRGHVMFAETIAQAKGRGAV